MRNCKQWRYKLYNLVNNYSEKVSFFFFSMELVIFRNFLKNRRNIIINLITCVAQKIVNNVIRHTSTWVENIYFWKAIEFNVLRLLGIGDRHLVVFENLLQVPTILYPLTMIFLSRCNLTSSSSSSSSLIITSRFHVKPVTPAVVSSERVSETYKTINEATKANVGCAIR